MEHKYIEKTPPRIGYWKSTPAHSFVLLSLLLGGAIFIMYRPPTRRAFLSPGDALEVRTRVSAADCRDVAPDQLRYEKLVLQHCSFFVSLKLYLSPGFTYRLFPPASPFLVSSASSPLDPCPPSPPVFQYLYLSCPVRFSSRLVCLIGRVPVPLQCGFQLLPQTVLAPISLVLPAVCGLLSHFLPSRSAFISISTAHALRRNRAAPLSACRGPQLGVQLLPWDPQSGQHGGGRATLTFLPRENKTNMFRH